MIEQIISFVTGFITNTIDASGYLGVAILMTIESAAIPLPSEIIMPFSGFLAATGRFSLLGLAFAGATGSVIGSWVTYAIGYYGGRPLIIRYGRYVLITKHDLEISERFFAKFGSWSTFIGRMLPIVRTFISVPAGIAKEPIMSFTVAAFVGSFIWSYFLAWLGFRFKENWHSLETYFRQFDALIVIVIIAFVIWWVRRHLKNRVTG